ncbi:hypothetical protein HYALB_00012102 [Hymenoscyphus albidus]|uniref:Uncharacterized protein n=1 Tax=Hymenoscyphus albidus TaxID=595503 RepID=A0A9N9LME6_9HELO|nr:hypothetical protein HYALB_00012102 [Hymenoscyphus albidus]
MQFNAILLLVASASVATAIKSATCLDGAGKAQVSTTMTACDNLKFFPPVNKCSDCKMSGNNCVSDKDLITAADLAKQCKDAGASGSKAN